MLHKVIYKYTSLQKRITSNKTEKEIMKNKKVVKGEESMWLE